ncbi:MAG: ROK family protein [Lachnospiraceae bacterium]|jgi:hypothetical protein|nr:ROK family protein [Lachnospiraceae bacterium]MCI8995852.1 ROK family protein [Lachnospiraceae bacterium]
MSLPTVSQNLKDLMADGLVCENGRFDSTGGRKAQAFCYNPDARFSVGLDVTRNHLGIVILNAGGEVVGNRRFRTPFSHVKSYYEMVWNLIDGFMDEFSIDRERILGVGIAGPAIVSSDGQYLTYSPVLGTDNIRLGDFPVTFLSPAPFATTPTQGALRRPGILTTRRIPSTFP